MAEWKKVVVSGSAAKLSNLKVDDLTSGNVVIGGGSAGNLTTTAINGSGNIVATTGATGVTMGALTDSHFTGSFTGSFTGDGSSLTGVSGEFPTTELAGIAFDSIDFFVQDAGSSKSVSGSQIQDYVYNGVSGDVTIDADGVAAIGSGVIVDADINGSAAIASSKINYTGTNIMSGSAQTVANLLNQATDFGTGRVSGDNFGDLAGTSTFTGSFNGDGSGLTGLATTLTATSDAGGTTTVDLQTQQLDIAGGTNINTATSAQTVTVNLDSTITGDITFSGNTVTVNNDLIVQGTASFQNTENLLVADQFILLNSGSQAAAPGGIVIQQDTQDIGEAFAWSSANSRWGVTGSFAADATTFAPDAFVNFVIEGSANDPDAEVVSKYDQKGNMFVGNTGDIWIYV